jgi:hypothetical protein
VVKITWVWCGTRFVHRYRRRFSGTVVAVRTQRTWGPVDLLVGEVAGCVVLRSSRGGILEPS